MAATFDPDGRVVILTAKRRAHIKDGHPELVGYQNEILEIVRSPSHRRPGPTLESAVPGPAGGRPIRFE